MITNCAECAMHFTNVIQMTTNGCKVYVQLAMLYLWFLKLWCHHCIAEKTERAHVNKLQ